MENNEALPSYSAFDGYQLLIQGPLEEVILHVKQKIKRYPHSSILVFSDLTGKQMDFDLSGSEKDVLQRLSIYRSDSKGTRLHMGPGRPKLGVVAREVSLLPRHWEWLSAQSGGASATLRRLIEDAKKNSSGKELIKQTQESTYKFMSAIGGNLPEYEEALRALYAKDKIKFHLCLAHWPKDIREHTKKMAAPIFNK